MLDFSWKGFYTGSSSFCTSCTGRAYLLPPCTYPASAQTSSSKSPYSSSRTVLQAGRSPRTTASRPYRTTRYSASSQQTCSTSSSLAYSLNAVLSSFLNFFVLLCISDFDLHSPRNHLTTTSVS
ncbi:hypothetical protein J5U21_01051 [Saccharolobus shibatae]|uniref:Uncharacterized protein n=1 Tax=Saccharolobus shibatae TaxID=2286 RepID=A0A8F5BTX0_9CREN|nr:hypothetical protein J5U21_01051 [Saccharolobus shibatae]